MTPPDRRAIVDYLASLDDNEYQQLSNESRTIARPANVRDSIHQKSGQLSELITRTNGNGYQTAPKEQQ